MDRDGLSWFKMLRGGFRWFEAVRLIDLDFAAPHSEVSFFQAAGLHVCVRRNTDLEVHISE